MADSLGPGVHTVKECYSLGFADLGDVEGFEEPGEGGAYGLLLVKDGHYARVPVQLKEPDWDVKLILRPPNMHLRPGKEGVLSHLDNNGRMAVSYNAPKTAPRAVINGRCPLYILRPKADSNANIPIQANAATARDYEVLEKPPASSTIYLTLVLGEPSPTKWVEILPKLKIQWDTSLICGFVIQNNKVRTTAPNVRAQISDKSSVGCHYFQVEPRIAFVQLFFTTEDVPDSYIEILNNNVNKFNALMMKT